MSSAVVVICRFRANIPFQDLDPYIEKVIPGLKQSLLDPVPEVRTVSARALGAMVKGMGSNKFDELMNWLMETLKSEGSSVDRSGAAQGKRESSKTNMVMEVMKNDQEYERNFFGKRQIFQEDIKLAIVGI